MLLTKANQQVDHMKQQILNFEKERDMLVSQTSKSQEMLNQLKTEKETLSLKVESLRQSSESLQKSYDLLQETHVKRNSENENLRNEFRQALLEIDKLKTALSSKQDQSLREELEAYRQRIDCSTCDGVKMKSEVLIKCGHMFCKDCVDLNVKSRKRQCPSCRVKFDIHDTRTIFWN